MTRLNITEADIVAAFQSWETDSRLRPGNFSGRDVTNLESVEDVSKANAKEFLERLPKNVECPPANLDNHNHIQLRYYGVKSNWEAETTLQYRCSIDPKSNTWSDWCKVPFVWKGSEEDLK